MTGSQYKPTKINGKISKLIFFALSVTVAGTSVAEKKYESSNTTYAWVADAHLHEEPVNNNTGLSSGNNVNIYHGEATDLMLFFAGNATKFENKHVGISVSLSW
ncbi:MAG: hypothetical protein KAI17_07905 [Thiotrichaceae bacterium]|nr:hypothetical protein [Thiotrichaceae bacterium]